MIPVFTPAKVASQEAAAILEIKSLQQLEEIKKQCTDKCVAVLFWAEWHQPCTQLRDQMTEMSKVYNLVKFAWVNSDEASDLVEKLDINQVPTLALIHPHKVAPELIENPNPEKLSETIEQQQEFYSKWFEEEKKKAFREIEDLVTQQPQFCIFIKGSPDAPKCKFTRKLLEQFAPHGYRFKHFDILKDERIRQWLKFYTNWPTFPQIFLGGKFVGGVDIVSELLEGGEFDEMVPQAAKRQPPIEEFKEILSHHKVIALLEGTAEFQNTPVSQQLTNILKKNSITYTALDVSQRSDILQAVTQAGIVSSVPCLFVDGKLLGDFNTVEKLSNSGELAAKMPVGTIVESLESKLKRITTQKKVMLFMKGSPKQPACGFSQKIVNLFANFPDMDYGYFDIFSDPVVREGLKKYSNWPTYPQVYVEGELIGGIDICQELHESGELEDALKGNSSA